MTDGLPSSVDVFHLASTAALLRDSDITSTDRSLALERWVKDTGLGIRAQSGRHARGDSLGHATFFINPTLIGNNLIQNEGLIHDAMSVLGIKRSAVRSRVGYKPDKKRDVTDT